MKRAGVRLRVFAAVLLAGACQGTPGATFELDVSPAVTRDTAWYEIGVFPGGCPPPAILLGGIPPQGTIARLAFAASGQAPALGLLPTETFGIAAVARAADCSVIGTGCATKSVSGAGALAVTVAPVSGQPAGACASGSVCLDAACLPSADGGVTDGATAPSVGESCTLALVGQGPLADPLGQDSTLLSAPAIAVTPTGFLLAYREFDPSLGTARLTTISIDATGAASAPVQTSLLEACSGSPQSDATGLAFSGSDGLVVLSRPACADTSGGDPPDGGDPVDAGGGGGGEPDGGEADGGGGGETDGGGSGGGPSPGGLTLITIDPTGAITGSAFTDAAGASVLLGQAHAVATTPAGTLLAYTDQTNQASFAATVNGTSLAMSPAPIAFKSFGVDSDTSAYVLGTAYGAAFLSESTGMSPTAVLATEGSDGSIGLGSSFTAAWASAGGAGSRVLVASSGSDSSSIFWSAFDIGSGAGKPPVQSGTFAPASMGNVSFADVAMAGDHAFVVAEVDESLSLFAFEKASTIPQLLGELPFASYPVIPIGQLQGGLVAIAATDARIAVVWGTGPTLGTDDDVGGYAVFRCAP